MARTLGTYFLPGTLEPLVSAPLDARATVKLKTDLTNPNTFEYVYIGMQTFVEEEQKRYTLIGEDFTNIANWREDGTATDAQLFQYAGSTLFANLPALNANRVGFVYNVSDNFTTTADFVEGAGNEYPGGTDVAIVNNGTAQQPSYKYDIFLGTLEGYQKKMQLDQLPTASAAEEGHIYQYVGESTSTLVNGYYYECIEDPDNPGEYIWEPKATQEASSNKLESPLTVSEAAGGIQEGTVYPADTSFETLWRNLLDPIKYPELTGPSVTIEASGDKLLEVGATASTTITATFDRGSIVPDYGTSGYRSGPATDYALNGGSAQASNEFTQTVSESNKNFKVVASYSQGEQPKDSIGENYSTPLAAGSVESDTLSFEFVNALWSNTAAIGTIAKNALVSWYDGEKIFIFPPATKTNPEVFDVPHSWTLTAIEVLNTLSGQWSDVTREFTKSITTHDNAGGVATQYDRYVCNLGYNMGSRQIKIKWSTT